jgi:riboflavin kinase/FMN adenylyltransferase
MEIFRHIHDRQLNVAASVVTMGNFDGLHIGHQALVRSAVAEAARLGVPSIVVTFEPHPLKILAPDRSPKLILSHKDKMQQLQSYGVGVVVIQTFDAAFARLTPAEFVNDFLVQRLKIEKVWVGSDFRFGRARKGSAEDLLRFGAAWGFEVGIVDPILVGGVRVSSSRIRQMIEAGRVDEVEPLLGRYHFISGNVVGGQRRGRGLGFPTANISSRTELLPLDGVYATLTEIGAERRLSVSNVGVNPTFGGGPRTVESFILDFDREIYSESVKLFFIKRIREERRFASTDQLVAQMHEDVNQARAILGGLRLNAT